MLQSCHVLRLYLHAPVYVLLMISLDTLGREDTLALSA